MTSLPIGIRIALSEYLIANSAVPEKFATFILFS